MEEGRQLYTKLSTVVNRYLKLPLDFLGSVPQDKQLSKAVMQQMPVSLQNPGAVSSVAYQRMAEILMNKETNQQVPKRGMAAFFSHIVTGKK